MPLGFEEAIAFIYNWGRLQPDEVALVIGAINYAQERLGPAGDAYRERLAAFVRLFDGGASFRYFREFRAGHFTSIPKDRVDGGDLADASEAGQHFYEKGDGTLGMGVIRLGIGMVVPLPHREQTAADLRLLGLTPGKSLYPVRPPTQARPEPLGIQPDTLWLTTRSTARMFELATLTVEVPEPHQSSGIAPPADALVNTGVRLPMRIRHSARQPASAYRVQHRGYWFYIDDTDMESKRIFQAIVGAYQSRIGMAPEPGAPQIVLPIGGGCSRAPPAAGHPREEAEKRGGSGSASPTTSSTRIEASTPAVRSTASGSPPIDSDPSRAPSSRAHSFLTMHHKGRYEAFRPRLSPS